MVLACNPCGESGQRCASGSGARPRWKPIERLTSIGAGPEERYRSGDPERCQIPASKRPADQPGFDFIGTREEDVVRAGLESQVNSISFANRRVSRRQRPPEDTRLRVFENPRCTTLELGLRNAGAGRGIERQPNKVFPGRPGFSAYDHHRVDGSVESLLATAEIGDYVQGEISGQAAPRRGSVACRGNLGRQQKSHHATRGREFVGPLEKGHREIRLVPVSRNRPALAPPPVVAFRELLPNHRRQLLGPHPWRVADDQVESTTLGEDISIPGSKARRSISGWRGRSRGGAR